LNRGRLFADDVCGLRQLLRRLELALGVDDLGPTLALGLAWRAIARFISAGRSTFLLRRPTPRCPSLPCAFDRLAQDRIDLVAVCEQLVHLGLTQHRSQRRLRELLVA